MPKHIVISVVASPSQAEAIEKLKQAADEPSRSKLGLQAFKLLCELYGIPWPEDDLPHGGDRKGKAWRDGFN